MADVRGGQTLIPLSVAQKFLDPVQSSDAERAVKAAGADNVLPEGRYLQNDFRTITQVVSLRNARGSERDTFCVSHAAMTCTKNVKTGMAVKLGEVRQGSVVFV